MQGHEDIWSNSTCSSIPKTFECPVRDTARRGLSPFFQGRWGRRLEQSPGWFLAIAAHILCWEDKTLFGSEAAQDLQCSMTGGERALCWGEHRKGLVGEVFPFSCLFSSTASALQEQLLAGTSPDPWPGLTAAELLTLLESDTWSPPKTQLLNGSSSCLLGFGQLFHLHNPLSSTVAGDALYPKCLKL